MDHEWIPEQLQRITNPNKTIQPKNHLSSSRHIDKNRIIPFFNSILKSEMRKPSAYPAGDTIATYTLWYK